MKIKGMSSILTIAIATVFWISLNIFHTEAVSVIILIFIYITRSYLSMELLNTVMKFYFG